MILYFKTSTHMEAAYGFSITIAMLMTTYLLGFFLIYRIKWNKMLVFALLLIFATIEFSFFIANVVKIKERWMFLFFELFIFMTMYVWFYARKINNRSMMFVEFGKYAGLLKELSNDTSVPKFATHLIYLTKADNRAHLEEKIIKSIFGKKPKRADVYWLLHINRVEVPYTLTYEVSELIEDKVFKLDINVGFRVQPRAEIYFKKIIKELIDNKEYGLHLKSDGSTKYCEEPNFTFVVVEKYLSDVNMLPMKESMIMKAFFYLKKLGLTDQKAFGLEKSDVIVESLPLLHYSQDDVAMTRVK